MPCNAQLKLIEPHYPVASRGRRPYALESMLAVHLMQNILRANPQERLSLREMLEHPWLANVHSHK